MKVYAKTDIGRMRELNEDSYYLPQPKERFCAIADGMGGHNAGEVASAMAIDIFAHDMRSLLHHSASNLCQAVARANASVYHASRRDGKYRGMGTTFTALMLRSGRATIAHVGDSRAYLVRGGEIAQLTVDHTFVQELVQRGEITPLEARHHPKRNLITRALGTEAEVEIDKIELELKQGDVFLLCTDGFSNYVTEREILAHTQSDALWQDKLDALIHIALQNGGSDNITALYAICEEGDL